MPKFKKNITIITDFLYVMRIDKPVEEITATKRPSFHDKETLQKQAQKIVSDYFFATIFLDKNFKFFF